MIRRQIEKQADNHVHKNGAENNRSDVPGKQPGKISDGNAALFFLFWQTNAPLSITDT